MRHVIEIFAGDCRIGKVDGPVGKRASDAVPGQNDLNKILKPAVAEAQPSSGGIAKQEIEVIRDFFTGHLVT
jgi:hypothetical protein